MTRVALAAAALAVIILGGREIRLSTAPRGLRNNNPGNIRETTGSLWDGQTGTDGQFAIFAAPEFGVRAMVRVLLNYERLHGVNTVRAIISRWAPPVENVTSSYIEHVARALDVDPDKPISVEDEIVPLVKTIIKHENGSQPYSDELIRLGVEMERGFSFA